MERTSFLLSNITTGIYFVVLFTTASAIKNMTNKIKVKLIKVTLNQKKWKLMYLNKINRTAPFLTPFVFVYPVMQIK